MSFKMISKKKNWVNKNIKWQPKKWKTWNRKVMEKLVLFNMQIYKELIEEKENTRD